MIQNEGNEARSAVQQWLDDQVSGGRSNKRCVVRRWGGERLLGGQGERPSRAGEHRLVWVEGQHSGGGEGALYAALHRWVRAQERTDGAMELLHQLTTAMDVGRASGHIEGRRQAVVDLVLEMIDLLSSQESAVWVVEHGGELSALESAIIGEVIGDVCDPSWSDAQGVEAGRLEFWLSESFDLQAEVDVDGVLDRMPIFEGRAAKWSGEGGLLGRLVEACDGDPTRLEALLSDLPSTVTFLWERQVGQLGSKAQAVLEGLSLAEQEVEVGFLERLLEEPLRRHLNVLEERSLIKTGMEKGRIVVSIAVPELAEALRQGMSEKKRRSWHGRHAKTAVDEAELSAAYIADHALAGGCTELARRFGLPGARRLMRHGRWERADALLGRLDKFLEDKEERGELLELKLRIARAQEDWRGARELAEELSAVAPSAEVELVRASCERRLGRHEVAASIYGSLWDAEVSAMVRLSAGIGLAELCFGRGEHERARRRLEALENVEDVLLEESVQGIKLRSLEGKIALFSGELQRADDRFNAARQVATRIGDRREAWRARINQGVVAVQKRRYLDARQRLKEVLEEGGARLGGLRVPCWLNLGIIAQREGDYGDAMQLYRRVLRDASRRGEEMAPRVALHNLATLYQDLGAFDQTEELLEGPGGEGAFTAAWREMIRAQSAWGRGDWNRALERFKKASRKLDEEGKLYAEEMVLRRILIHLWLGELPEAQGLRQEVEIYTPQGKSIEAWVTCEAEWEVGGELDEDRWRDAIDRLEDMGQRRDAMMARYGLCRALEQSDQPGASARLLAATVERLKKDLEGVPETFREDYLQIYAHRRIVAQYRETQGGEWVESLGTRKGSPEEDGGEGFDRSDPDYRRWRRRFPAIVGEDARLIEVLRVIDRVAPGKHSVLISGESGTGKELIAEAIHHHSDRAANPFVKVNCAAFVDELLLSELFGHEKGAFTGAVSTKAGRFERADGGTLFLDEIADISPKTQVALLRVLQDGVYERVGGSSSRRANVRVVAATNRDLEQLVEEGKFRLDLYYRLKGFCVELPPLRDRREDIPLLTRAFSEEMSDKGQSPEFCDEVIQFLARYRWPGNIRELKNFVRSALVFRDEGAVTMSELGQFRQFFDGSQLDESLPPVSTERRPWEEAETALSDGLVAEQAVEPEEALVDMVVCDGDGLSQLKKRLEQKCIRRALRETGGNITHAAKILKMKRPRLSQIVNGDPELLELKKELVS